MHAARGSSRPRRHDLARRGGGARHGKCCVAGCGDIKVDYTNQQFTARNGQVVKKGDVITLDGSSGEVMMGQVPTVQPELTGDFGQLMAGSMASAACGCAPTPTPA